MFRKILAASLGVLMALALAGCGQENAVQYETDSGLELSLPEKFAGVVVAHGEQEIKSDTDKTVSVISVKEGDEVKEGQTLFTYDMEAAALNLEKASLELEQLNNSLSARQADRVALVNERDLVSSENQLSYTVEIQSCDVDIREIQYNIAVKQKEVDKLKAANEVKEAVAPIGGRVKSVKENNNEGEESVTITIIEEGSFRVMGYVNENNAAMLAEEMEVIIMARNSDDTWTGKISYIDWTSPVSSESSYDSLTYSDSSSSDESSLTSSSKYPFYVELETSEGLLLGQHVYVAVSEVSE